MSMAPMKNSRLHKKDSRKSLKSKIADLVAPVIGTPKIDEDEEDNGGICPNCGTKYGPKMVGRKCTKILGFSVRTKGRPVITDDEEIITVPKNRKFIHRCGAVVEEILFE